MLEAIQIHKYYGIEHVLNDVSVRVDRHDKIGVIGRNGAGKTTLIQILTGVDTDFQGKIVRTEHETVAFVSQFFPNLDISALDYMIEPFLEMRRELNALEETMSVAEGKDLERACTAYGELRSAYDAQKGDDAEQRALTFLESIRLSSCADTSVSVLSGGERNILAMGRALVQRADILILDEPGNHLDMYGLAWLENFIREYQGAVVVVSHNRYLLDRVCSAIIEVEGGKARRYNGNYSAYRLERLRTAVSGELSYKADQKKIAQLETVVARFADIARRTADPSWGRRLRARKTHLEKIKAMATEKPNAPDTSFSVSFTNEVSRASIALKVNGLSCGFGERVLVSDAHLLLQTGERVALVGKNGSGKTTFLNEVLRLAKEQDPRAYIGPSLTVAYCSQHGETLHKEFTIFQECMNAGSKNEDDAYRTLSRFLFPRTALEQKVGNLSGGEMNKLQLAIAVIQKADFLILDEPTNHLDIPSREAIEDALSDFAGTILTVSHDRYFLDRIANRVIEISNGTLTSWDGNFSEFWFAQQHSENVQQPVKKVSEPVSKSSSQSVEERIYALEAEQKETERNMSTLFNSGELMKARTLGRKLERITHEIERLYERL
jgi:ATP-binding cassette subfamily F protein 3